MLFLLPKLKEDVWEFFGETRPDPVIPLTGYQKSWLKTVLMDKRIGLFLEKEELRGLLEQLSEIEPLFRQEDICATDIFLEGDDFEDEVYRENFRTVVSAIRARVDALGKCKFGCKLTELLPNSFDNILL